VDATGSVLIAEASRAGNSCGVVSLQDRGCVHGFTVSPHCLCLLTQCCKRLRCHPPPSRVIIKLQAQPAPHQEPPRSTNAVLCDPLDGSSSSSSTNRTCTHTHTHTHTHTPAAK
jgi:hypothetical protein